MDRRAGPCPGRLPLRRLVVHRGLARRARRVVRGSGRSEQRGERVDERRGRGGSGSASSSGSGAGSASGGSGSSGSSASGSSGGGVDSGSDASHRFPCGPDLPCDPVTSYCYHFVSTIVLLDASANYSCEALPACNDPSKCSCIPAGSALDTCTCADTRGDITETGSCRTCASP